MKSGHMIIMFEKYRGWNKMRHHKQSQSLDWRQSRWCCVSGGTEKESSLWTVATMQNDWVRSLSKTNAIRAIQEKRPELISRKTLSFIRSNDNVRSHTFLMTRQKLRELFFAGKFWWIHHSSDLAPSDY